MEPVQTTGGHDLNFLLARRRGGVRTLETKKEKGETNKKHLRDHNGAAGTAQGPGPSPGEGLCPGPPVVTARIALTGSSGLPGLAL